MKNRTKILIGASVLLIALLSFRNCSCSRTKEKTKPVISNNNKLLTNPPIPGLDIPYQTFTINPSISNVVYSKFGAKINIPANAFLDNEGNVIKDKVVVSFREFYNPLDFYLAGIPMAFNDNGEEKVLESGGMVELTAQSNKKELFVNPESKINVDLFSWTKSKDFNLYDLDKAKGTWIERGKDSIQTTTVAGDNLSLPEIPPMPKVASRDSFTIIDDTKEFPEIEEYKNVHFEPIDIATCRISDAQEMKVKPLKNGIFEVTSIVKFGSFKKESKCLCYLAFEEGKDYSNALKIYQKKYAKLIAKRKQITDKIKFEWDKYFGIVKEYNKRQIKDLSGEEKIIRTLTINNFGFVNCDYPTSYPSGGEFNPIYVNENGKPIELANVVLVERNTNALFRYSDKVKYNPSCDNILWGLTKDNKIAYIKNVDFSLITNTPAEQKVQMHIHKEKLKTYEDVANVLFH
ncbi:hypothetical protein [Flavobacterium sp.]|uniref:hypothetical protein n=1 Tax=Flavobacterium sp. TaxID=239 RepID=UPI0033416D15